MDYMIYELWFHDSRVGFPKVLAHVPLAGFRAAQIVEGFRYEKTAHLAVWSTVVVVDSVEAPRRRGKSTAGSPSPVSLSSGPSMRLPLHLLLPRWSCQRLGIDPVQLLIGGNNRESASLKRGWR